MNNPLQEAKTTEDSIQSSLIEIIEEMTMDWDTDYEEKIGTGTRLISDLSFESIDIVQLVVAIETRFDRRDFPFEKLMMSEGRYVEELNVGEIVEFVTKHSAA